MKNKKDLILHVGHPKTGTSAIQAALALNVSLLEKVGIHYPYHNSFAKAQLGHISSGNFPEVPSIKQFLDELMNSEHSRILLSSERLFRYILDDELVIREILESEFNVRVVLFIRDPLEHLLSGYGQMVKRGGEVNDISKYLLKYAMPRRVLNFIKKCESNGFEYDVLNYSKCKSNVVGSFFHKLSVPTDRLIQTENKVINRSLTRSELKVQIFFNQCYGKESSRMLADRFCNELPQVEPEKIKIDRSSLCDFLDRIFPICETVNEYLDDDSKYEIGSISDYGEYIGNDNNNRYMFTPEQLNILFEAFSHYASNSSEVEI